MKDLTTTDAIEKCNRKVKHIQSNFTDDIHGLPREVTS